MQSSPPNSPNDEVRSIEVRSIESASKHEASKYVLAVVGPTAVGKTELCVKLARRFGTEIVSADSRQFFRELTIGTAKPGAAEQGGIPHHFVDSHGIAETYNAGAFERDALAKLAELFTRASVAILTGGSGLYIRLVTEGMDEMPPADPEVRAQLNETFQREGLAPLLTQLDQLDPAYAATVDRANPQRVMRALEVCLSTGQPYSAFRQGKKADRPFRTVKIGLNRDRAELYDRIDRRMDAMLAAGLVEEVRSLSPYRHHNALQTVGYSEVFGYLDGAYDYAEMVRLLKRNSRRYAKRQLTWFTRDPDIRWFHPDDYEAIVQYAETVISNQ
jgi:tRNA dimethylallyltransferase